MEIEVDYLRDEKGWYWYLNAGPSNPLGVSAVRYRTLDEAERAVLGLKLSRWLRKRK